MLPPAHGHSFSRSSQQVSTKYSQGAADALGSSSSHYQKHLDKNTPNIGSTGKMISQMDMMKQAKLPKNTLPTSNVFSPVGSPHPIRQQHHHHP